MGRQPMAGTHVELHLVLGAWCAEYLGTKGLASARIRHCLYSLLLRALDGRLCNQWPHNQDSAHCATASRSGMPRQHAVRHLRDLRPAWWWSPLFGSLACRVAFAVPTTASCACRPRLSETLRYAPATSRKERESDGRCGPRPVYRSV